MPLTNEQAVQQVQERLKTLQSLIHDINDERKKSENTITCIKRSAKTHPHKLRSLYKTAIHDCQKEENVIRHALKKISEIREIRNERRIQSRNAAGHKVTIRQGELMKLVSTLAKTLPLYISKIGEKVPPLCGSIPAEPSYTPKPGDLVSAYVKLSNNEKECDWILAEVVTHHANGKLEVVDIDAELKTKTKYKHVLGKRHIIPLPLWRANPETDPHALYPKDTMVLALYPQTTTFYRGICHEPPATATDEYQILFEDNTYKSGYSPPFMVAQRYVFSNKQCKKSLNA